VTPIRRWAGIAVLVLALVAAACGGDSSSTTKPTTTSTPATTARTAANTDPCGAPTPPPARYDSVVVFSFENRRWSDVGLGFGPQMPYLHRLGSQCTWFPQWTETDITQNSLTQYIGQVTGARQPGTENDCSPSITCSTQADNLFRQVRASGRRGINYVEGATRPCSASGNAVRHIPAMYLWAPEDRAQCAAMVRPLRELDLAHLPAFAFVTPNTCNDGHDCDNATVDAWARTHIQPVLDSRAYRAGRVAVFVWYDEDSPVPNLWITPSAPAGPRDVPGAGYATTLRAWESMLGLPCLANACAAPDLTTVVRP
jgi:acid phosphatase